MQFESQPAQVQQTQFFTPGLRLLILGLFFITALGVRIYQINNDAQFHPTRQYRSAIIARGYFFNMTEGIPEWRRQIAILNKDHEGLWEPPIVELVASFAYKVVGEERIWIPKLLSSIFWLIGGGFLFLIAKRLASSDAALLCTAFYLFVPFGIYASGSFQPDSLMVMGLLISTFTIVQYYDKRSTLRFLTASVVSSLAIAIKFVSLFPILGVFIIVGIHSEGFRIFVRSLKYLGFAFLSILPAAVFYSYGLFVSKSLTEVARLDIMPHLLIQPYFWIGWAEQMEGVIGLPALIGALLGTVLLRGNLARGLLIGLWSGYFVFGLIFSYTVSTHDYWNLKIIPIAALSLAPIGAIIMDSIQKVLKKRHSRLTIASIIMLAVIISMYNNRNVFHGNNEQIKRVAKEIGEIVGHSTQTVLLSHHYGKPLRYHGEIAGMYWPRSIIYWKYKRPGERALTVQERLDNLGFAPAYFIITAFEEFRKHHVDLREFLLVNNCPLVAESKYYLIYGACGKH